MNRWPTRLLALFALLAGLFVGRPARAELIRDLCDVVGVRDNQLVGYGVVTGLQTTGDDVNMAPFAAQSLLAMLRRLGVQVETANQQIRLRNVAAVLVTGTLPPFARSGARLDLTVSSIGNAKSLVGGVLLQTLLVGADMHVYAVGQGPLIVGGYEAKGSSGSSVMKNSTNTARVPGGALVEREVTARFVNDESITLSLRSADFTTAQRVVEAVEKKFAGSASAVDGGSIKVKIPAEFKANPVKFVSTLIEYDVKPAMSARVVINERTGTIVAGGDVRLAPVAISHGNLTVVVKETPQVVQPLPFAKGETKVVPRTEINTTESAGPAMTFVDGAASLADVAKALTALGVTPRDLTSVLQALKQAGALRAELVVQ